MELVQILTAIVVAFLEQTYPIKELADVMSATNRAAAQARIPALKEAFKAYDKGQDFDWAALSEGLKAYANEYSKRPGARSSMVNLLRVYANYYRTSSERALAQIEKYTADMDSPYLRGYFEQEVVDQTQVKNALSPLVKKLGGKGAQLTLDEAKAAREADPVRYREYLELRKQFTSSWKTPMSNFIRNSGEHTVSLHDVLSHLKSHGIEADLPKGFVGRIDANGNVYTVQGEKIAGGLPSPGMFPSVRMNPTYDGDQSPWVFQAIRPDGSPGNYAYTVEYQRTKAREKFEKVKSFDVEKTRKKWLPLINQFDPNYPDPASVSAIVLEILYRTSNRIGTRPMDNPKAGGFGILTLLKAHYYPQEDGSIKFIYLGKDSVRTVSVIKKTDDQVAARVCKAVADLVRDKGPRDPIFTYTQKNGAYRIVQPGVVNRLFDACSGVPELTVHKLRTAKGSRLFREFMDGLFARRKNLTPAEVMEMVKKGGAIVGKELNHVRRSAEGETTVQPMTSLKNYIDPALQAEVFLHYGAPIPKYLEAMMQESADNAYESASVKDPMAVRSAWVRGADAGEGESDPEPTEKELDDEFESEKKDMEKTEEPAEDSKDAKEDPQPTEVNDEVDEAMDDVEELPAGDVLLEILNEGPGQSTAWNV